MYQTLKMRPSKEILLAPLLLTVFILNPVRTQPALGLPLKLHFPPYNINRPQPSRRRVGFFADNPLTSVKRSFQDIQSNVERSMQSLLAAGSAIGQRMLGMITRAPRLLNTQQIRFSQNPQPLPGHPSHPAPQPPAPVVFHQVQQQHNHGEVFPNFDDCDCQFGAEHETPKFQPYVPANNVVNIPIYEPAESDSNSYNEVTYDLPQSQAIETYGSPAAPVAESYGSPEAAPQESYASPTSTDVDTYGPPQAPIIQPVQIISDSGYSPSAQPSEDSYGTPLAPLIQPDLSSATLIDDGLSAVDQTSEVFDNSLHTIDHSTDLSDEPVIHPGGSQDIDIHKVEILGAASVVQSASAQVPDQSHPEKYLNFDSDLLQNVVDHNLWYKQTKKLKHHKHGKKLKVIPHLADGVHDVNDVHGHT